MATTRIIRETPAPRNPLLAVLRDPPPLPCPACAAQLDYDGLHVLTSACGWHRVLSRQETDDFFFALLGLSDVQPALFLAALGRKGA